MHRLLEPRRFAWFASNSSRSSPSSASSAPSAPSALGGGRWKLIAAAGCAADGARGPPALGQLRFAAPEVVAAVAAEATREEGCPPSQLPKDQKDVVAQTAQKSRRLLLRASRAVDAWALGCLLFELLSGGRPVFAAEESDAEVVGALLGKKALPWEDEEEETGGGKRKSSSSSPLLLKLKKRAGGPSPSSSSSSPSPSSSSSKKKESSPSSSSSSFWSALDGADPRLAELVRGMLQRDPKARMSVRWAARSAVVIEALSLGVGGGGGKKVGGGGSGEERKRGAEEKKKSGSSTEAAAAIAAAAAAASALEPSLSSPKR